MTISGGKVTGSAGSTGAGLPGDWVDRPLVVAYATPAR